MTTAYPQPKSLPRGREYELTINGVAVDVLKSDLATFAVCAVTEGAVEVALTATSQQIREHSIHPLSAKIAGEVDAHRTLRFTLPKARDIMVSVPGLPDFYLYVHGQAEDVPASDEILVIRQGQVIESPMIDLEGYNGLHIEGGAVLKTRVVVLQMPGLRITGHGIFDGSYYTRAEGVGCIPSIVLHHCPNCVVEDITMINPCGWMLLLGVCDGARVSRLKQLGAVVSSDGVDVVGSSNVLIEDCFLSNNDDCVVIKAFEVGEKNLNQTHVDCREAVEDVSVRRCVFVNGPAGNAMEIGHELSVDHIRNVRFEDIDVVSVHGVGAVFSLHNNDRATVEGVVFENIRVEHCFDKFLDFRISRSRFSTDGERGRIRDVLLRNIYWNYLPFNEGYTISLIGGWSEDNRVENVRIENFYKNDEKITDVDFLEICTRYADQPVMIG